METAYRVMIVEDIPEDAELTEREILQVLTPCIFKRVENKDDFLDAIDDFKPDIIVSDYSMPSFDGLTALELTLERIPLTPFILVTGSINEDTAVDCMKAGANNYIIKQHLKRLGPAVLRALEEKKVRVERFRAREALAESEEKYRTLVENAGKAIFVVQDGMLKFVNPKTEDISSFSREELLSKPFIDFIHPDDRAMVSERNMKRLHGFGVPSRYAFRIVQRSGETRWVELSAALITWADKLATLNFLSDITDRVKMEEEIKKRIAELEEFYNMAVGRELKMVELKNEIEQLKARLAKYEEA
jgi:PAS domain S-box-containing protein